jgi:sugar lactone lactonase YvrE
MHPKSTPSQSNASRGELGAVGARFVLRGVAMMIRQMWKVALPDTGSTSCSAGRRTITTAVLALGLLFAIVGPAQATDGTFSRAIGFGVNPTGSGGSFEVCTVAANCAVGGNGAVGGEFNDVEGVATDAAGNIWVAETNGQRIQKLDPSGKFLLALGKNVNLVGGASNFGVCTVAQSCQAAATGTLTGQFDDPRGIATGAAGDVYVADALNGRVQKFDSSGNILSVIGTGGGHGGEFDFPTGVSTDAQGNLYVAEEAGNRISKFDSSGHFVLAFGKDVVTGGGTGFEVCTVAANCKIGADGALGGELFSPNAAAADGSGNIYVVDSGNHRVEKYDASGNFLFAFGEDVDSVQPGTGFEICTVAANCKAGLPSDQAGAFNFPEGVATDAAGNVYVSDLENSRIEEFDSSGHLLRIIGSLGSDLGGQFRGQFGLSTDAAGDLYVADAGNNRIQEFADAPPTGSGTGGTGTGGSGTGGTGGTGGKPSSVPPRVTHVTESHLIWRAGTRLATSEKKVRRAPVGTKFSFILDQPARVSLAFVQDLQGRKVKSRCVAPTNANRGKHACGRQIPAATLTFTAHTGTNQLTFQGRVSRSKRLRSGHYTVTFTATNAARLRSVPRSLSFTIVS